MTDKLPQRPHAHRARRRPPRGRSWARLSVLPLVVAAAAVAVAGTAFGFSVRGLGTSLDTSAVPMLGDTPAAAPETGQGHARPAPRTPSAVSRSEQRLSSGRTLSPAPKPSRTPVPARAPKTRGPGGASTPTASASPSATSKPSPRPSRQHSAATPSPTADRPTAAFRVASFNMLGASHTGPHSQRPRFATGATRAPWAVQLLNDAGITVAGLQEFQAPQIRAFNRVATGWHAWPGLGSRAGVNSVVWRTSTWRPVQTHTLDIPYFGGRDVPMPYVLLRHVPTGRLVWFANFHNPADAHGPAQGWRNEAVRREVALVNRLHSGGTPVIVTGDFNDRAAFFCPIAGGAGVTSADGSHLSGGGCDLAPNPGVDWIVGTRDDLDFSNFHRLRGGLVARTSDHPFVWSGVTAH